MPDPAVVLSTPDAAPRRVVVVLGMHRSGTSLVAGCLQRLGVDFGPRLMPPDPDNPRGYFEHNDVVNLHDRLLLALDRSWDETAPFPADWWLDAARLDPYRQQLLAVLRRDFPDAPLWGIKDPRLCSLLPWWQSVWQETGSRPLFILVRRDPAEVASSLAKREGMSAAKASLLWLRHMLEAERWTRARERALVDFSDFRTNEKMALARLRQALGLPNAADPEPTRLVDPTLGHSGAVAKLEEVFPWVQAADECLRLGLAGDEGRMREGTGSGCAAVRCGRVVAGTNALGRRHRFAPPVGDEPEAGPLVRGGVAEGPRESRGLAAEAEEKLTARGTRCRSFL